MCERCARLEAENARLRFDLAQKVRADIMGRLREGLGLSVHQARFVLLLYRAAGKTVDHDTLAADLPARYTKSADGQRSEHYLRVMVYQTRRATGPRVIGTDRAHGYFLTEHGLYVVREALAGQFMMRAA